MAPSQVKFGDWTPRDLFQAMIRELAAARYVKARDGVATDGCCASVRQLFAAADPQLRYVGAKRKQRRELIVGGGHAVGNTECLQIVDARPQALHRLKLDVLNSQALPRCVTADVTSLTTDKNSIHKIGTVLEVAPHRSACVRERVQRFPVRIKPVDNRLEDITNSKVPERKSACLPAAHTPAICPPLFGRNSWQEGYQVGERFFEKGVNSKLISQSTVVDANSSNHEGGALWL